jgi:hypothetical protein
MATYRVLMLFGQGLQGWSEGWYMNSSRTPQDLALNVIVQPAFLGEYTAMKGTQVFVQAVRISDVDQPRNAYLVPVDAGVTVYGGGGYGVGDMSGASLLTDLYAGTTSRKPFLYRGLAESLSNFDTDGFAVFTATFKQAWNRWITWLTTASGLQIRVLNRANPPTLPDVPVASLQQAQLTTNYTWVNVVPPNLYSFPQVGRIVFHKLPRRTYPQFTGTIPYTLNNATQLQLPVEWSAPVPTLYPAGATCRVAGFTYANVTRGEYRDFRTRKVGRPFGPARGRRPGVKYRAS